MDGKLKPDTFADARKSNPQSIFVSVLKGIMLVRQALPYYKGIISSPRLIASRDADLKIHRYPWTSPRSLCIADLL